MTLFLFCCVQCAQCSIFLSSLNTLCGCVIRSGGFALVSGRLNLSECTVAGVATSVSLARRWAAYRTPGVTICGKSLSMDGVFVIVLLGETL